VNKGRDGIVGALGHGRRARWGGGLGGHTGCYPQLRVRSNAPSARTRPWLKEGNRVG
jgi:hypothetical protein